jgi:hypothetical protein
MGEFFMKNQSPNMIPTKNGGMVRAFDGNILWALACSKKPDG